MTSDEIMAKCTNCGHKYVTRPGIPEATIKCPICKQKAMIIKRPENTRPDSVSM